MDILPIPNKIRYFPNLINEEQSMKSFNTLKNKVQWHAGIKSRGRETRKAYQCPLLSDNPMDIKIRELVLKCVDRCVQSESVIIQGIYLNYYRDGDDWTPQHNHPGTMQLIMSFGATRELKIGSKSYDIKSGDVILFGEQKHGIPKNPSIKESRISIAVFLTPIQLSF